MISDQHHVSIPLARSGRPRGVCAAVCTRSERPRNPRSPLQPVAGALILWRKIVRGVSERLDLRSVYGDDPAFLDGQFRRYYAALEAFAEHYGRGPVNIFRAPGRVNLIGEHTDYSQGYVLPVALDRDVLLLARARPDGQVRLCNIEPEFGPSAFSLSASIPSAAPGDWSNYVRGAAQLMATEFGASTGMDALVCGAEPLGIPRGAGLSSSSALTVAAGLALAELNGLNLAQATLAEACGRAEWYVGTRGGIMDQFASLVSRTDSALLLDCRPDAISGRYTYRHVPLPRDCAIMVVDSGTRHNNTGPLFNTRVAEVRTAVALLRQVYPEIKYLRDMEGIPWEEYADLLPERISTTELENRGLSLGRLLDSGTQPPTSDLYVQARCRHVITENARVLKAVSALERGDVPQFGQLMSQAHRSVRDDFEVSTQELEILTKIALRLPGVYGARLTGAGWGGCIVALVERTCADSFADSIQRDYYSATGIAARAFVCQASAGACRVSDIN